VRSFRALFYFAASLFAIMIYPAVDCGPGGRYSGRFCDAVEVDRGIGTEIEGGGGLEVAATKKAYIGPNSQIQHILRMERGTVKRFSRGVERGGTRLQNHTLLYKVVSAFFNDASIRTKIYADIVDILQCAFLRLGLKLTLDMHYPTINLTESSIDEECIGYLK
jgi:hypothetical protein